MKPKSVRSVARYTLGALSIGVLAACGGEGSGGGIDIADGGIRGTGSSVGPVSGFGSVIVNGVRFDTSGLKNEEVESDDGISVEADLDEGMILRVDGNWKPSGEGTAFRLEYDDTLRGPVVVESAWDAVSKTASISILGLVVNIDRQTVIKGVALPDELADGDVVRVSGWRLANGEFRASLIRVHSGTGAAFDADNEIELEGQVGNFDANACSFEIGTVLVRCNEPNIQFEALAPADLAGSPFIEVEGNLVSGELIASEIREDDQRRYRPGDIDDIEFSGPVTRDFEDASDSFEVNGVTVNITSGTEFDDGLTVQDLVSGLLIQVEGNYQANGTVNADEIELREANAEVEGPIQGEVNRVANTFNVGGVLVQITPLTFIENDDDDSRLTRDELLHRLGDGVEVEVDGIERENNGDVFLEALKIDIDDDQSSEGQVPSFELQGKLRAVDSASLSILGVDMSVSNTDFGDTSTAELQSLIQPFQNKYPIVEVEYEKLAAGVFQYRAIEVELEDDD